MLHLHLHGLLMEKPWYSHYWTKVGRKNKSNYVVPTAHCMRDHLEIWSWSFLDFFLFILFVRIGVSLYLSRRLLLLWPNASCSCYVVVVVDVVAFNLTKCFTLPPFVKLTKMWQLFNVEQFMVFQLFIVDKIAKLLKVWTLQKRRK